MDKIIIISLTIILQICFFASISFAVFIADPSPFLIRKTLLSYFISAGTFSSAVENKATFPSYICGFLPAAVMSVCICICFHALTELTQKKEFHIMEQKSTGLILMERLSGV